MKKLLFISAIALFGVANVQAEEPAQLPNVQDVHIDHDSWSYVQEQFGSLLQDKTGLKNKLGKSMQDYAQFIAMALCLSSSFYGGYLLHMHDREEPINTELFFGIPAIITTAKFISFPIFYKLLKITGRFLEAKPAACELSLKQFLKKWPSHKLKTPQALQPILDVLYQDLKKNRGKFTAISQEEIQKLIETVLAISLAVSTIR